MPTHPGIFIVIEGADGAGKSTLQKALAHWLGLLGWTTVCSREPTSGPHGMALRQAAKTKRLPPEQELALLILDRKAHLADLIEPALTAGHAVILDRYYFSTVAYQGAAGLDPLQLQATMEAFARKPDILLILDLPVPTSIARIQARGTARDDFERDDTLHFVRDTFLRFASLPYAQLIDANQSIEQVHAAAKAAVTRFLQGHLGTKNLF